MTNNQQFPILAASACVRRGDEVLLIQRGKEPGIGKWTFPGGKVKWGETAQHAALRELREEAGILAKTGGLVGLYEVIYPDMHFAIACYSAFDPVGEIQAANDAADARWVKINRLSQLPLVSTIEDAVAASIKLNPLR